MARTYRFITPVVVDDQVAFNFTALCRASGADEAQLLALVEEGLLQPNGRSRDDWQFSGQALPRARQALRLARDLGLGLSGAAIVMDLLAEIESLQARVRRG
jgi:chaperone modulatory protein CbpM